MLYLPPLQSLEIGVTADKRMLKVLNGHMTLHGAVIPQDAIFGVPTTAAKLGRKVLHQID